MKKPSLSSLPAGYIALDYIQTTGTQYIDTGIQPNQNTRVVIDFQASNNACHIFGARTAFLNKGFLVCWITDFVYCVQVANGNWNGGVFDETTRHTISLTASAFQLDGETKATYTVDAFQCEYNLYLASCPNSNESENMQGKIFSCQIYDNDTLVRDLVPCMSDADGVGLFDLVNNQFYGNAGTGSFVGSEVAA